MFFRLSILTLVIAAVTLGTPIKRDVAQVKQDIETVSEKATALDNAVNALPSSGGTPVQVVNIHEETLDLDKAIQDATEDVNASPQFDDTQADSILESIQIEILPIIKKGLADLVAKKSALFAVGAGPVAESDLKTLLKDTDTFGEAFSSKMPADKQGQAKQVLNNIDSEINGAIEAFSA